MNPSKMSKPELIQEVKRLQQLLNQHPKQSPSVDEDNVFDRHPILLASECAKIGLWDQHFASGQVIRNTQWASMLGYQPHEIEETIGSWQDLIHPEDLPAVIETTRAHEAGETPFFQVEHRMKAKSGEWRWVMNLGKIIERDASGQPLRALGAHIDINHQKIAEVKISKISNLFCLMGVKPQDNIDIIVQQTCEILNGACSLYNRLDNKNRSLLVWSQHNAPPNLDKHPPPKGHICYEATIKGQDKPVILEELKGTSYELTDPNVQAFGLRSYLGFPVTVKGKTVGSLCIVDIHPRQFSKTDIQIIATLAKAISLEEERQLDHNALKESRKRYQTLIENIPLPVFVHREGDCLYVNPECLAYFNTGTKAELLHKKLFNQFTKEGREEIHRLARSHGSKRKNHRAELTVHLHNESRIVEAKSIAVNYNGEKAHLVMFQDISHQKAREGQIEKDLKEKELLLKEIHHRVKNNLQVVSSLLNLQAQQIMDEDALNAFHESRNRIRSIALVHEELYHSTDLSNIDFAQYLRNLSHDLYRAYQTSSSRVKLEMNIQEVTLGIDKAVPCGLIINELISNALKYAFPHPQENSGIISITLNQDKQGIHLIIQDDGIGLPQNFDIEETQSLGLHLVKILVEDQLKGRLSISNHSGSMFDILF